jgi:TRAP-type C4-dicarboxylate transport system permease small subunit
MSGPALLPRLAQLRDRLVRLEEAVLVILMLGMMTLAVAQIVLRNTVGSGLVWGETAVRILVLWTALIGATLASRSGQHISMDLAGRYLPPRARRLAKIVADLFAAAACAAVAWYSVGFTRSEYASGTTVFGDFPSWPGTVIIPLAFGVIALRYFLSGVLALARKSRDAP